MTKAIQQAPQEPTAYEKLFALITETPTTRATLQSANNPEYVRAQLETHAEAFDRLTDKMAATTIFAQESVQTASKFQGAFLQAAMKARREMPTAERLPYPLHKLANEVAQIKADQIVEQAKEANVSPVVFLRQDKGVEVTVTEQKKVNIIQHAVPKKNAPKP